MGIDDQIVAAVGIWRLANELILDLDDEASAAFGGRWRETRAPRARALKARSDGVWETAEGAFRIVVDTPADGAAGIAVKLELFQELIPSCAFEGWPKDLLDSAASDARRLAGPLRPPVARPALQLLDGGRA